LATLHGEALGAYAPKIVSNVVRRLRDPDSNIRDVYVEVMGVLASQIGGTEAGASLNIFVKLLLEALGEQNLELAGGRLVCELVLLIALVTQVSPVIEDPLECSRSMLCSSMPFCCDTRERNKHVQVGASLCLARVIESTKDPHTGTLQRLCPRIVKLLSSPSFLANASLLPAI